MPVTLKSGSHWWDKHKHKHQAYAHAESVIYGTKSFMHVCMPHICACAHLTSVNQAQISIHTNLKMLHLMIVQNTKFGLVIIYIKFNKIYIF